MTARTDLTITVIDGETVTAVLPVVDESMPALVREGLARRRLVASGQSCPCGARMRLPSRQQRRWAARKGEVLHIYVQHGSSCPAVTANILEALSAAGWSR